MRNLRQHERCPLHKNKTCECHGASKERKTLVDVERVPDPHHPRGYREICSERELAKRKKLLVESAEKPVCMYCGGEFLRYQDIALAHRNPKGFDGAFRDDSLDNLGLAHHPCNFQNGSKRPAA